MASACLALSALLNDALKENWFLRDQRNDLDMHAFEIKLNKAMIPL